MYVTSRLCLISIIFLCSCSRIDNNAEIPIAKPAPPQSTDIGTHIIYFNTILTSELSDIVARENNIKKSSHRALLNISIIEKDTQKSSGGEINVEISNLLGQQKEMSMRMINKNEIIYFLGETKVANRETLFFNILIMFS